ncbi:DUF131 domain-containing protein [Methanolobus mangrovi]|uniref:DUF131 domain-containing protein n=1 Tax=Methanolobus mangrovi TaxID=3072977 RepID=A0AA51YJ57_9EURY|nr:DUF131 domain-containing protein [Methanolobus mangrovi]WMW22248.1 DUF131 domain-containing protein [Methanolobus mangrovi]
MRSSQDIFNTGIALVIMGFVLVFAGVLSSSFNGTGDFGGLILIGPIPITFGSSPEITSSMLWSGVLIALVYLIVRRRL